MRQTMLPGLKGKNICKREKMTHLLGLNGRSLKKSQGGV